MTGRIRNFNEPSPEKPVSILSAATARGAEVQQQPEPQQVEVTMHEEVIREGQDSIRRPADDSGVEIRFRSAKNPQAWEDVKRGQDS